MDEPGVKARCFRPAQLAGKLQMTITYRGRVGFQGLVSPGCPALRQVAPLWPGPPQNPPQWFHLVERSADY